MSYQVLARRWRPRRFDEIIGQEHVTKTLSNAIRAGRLAHAFLLCGPRGVGKTTTARVLAKCLNCETAGAGPVVDPCNNCSACLEIDEARSLDVLEIDGASNRGIDEIRDLRENVRYAPSAGRAKVYIIDEVHMLTKEAFNALLKTLEEPPPGVYFVFATTEVHKVPATIRSRCQRYDFHRISNSALIATLARLAEKEKIAADDAALAEIARHADGGLRDAESLLDQAAAVAGGRITLETIRDLLGEAEEGVLLRIAESVAGGDAPEAFRTLQELLDRGFDPSRLALSLAQTFRDLLVARDASGDLVLLGLRADLLEESRRIAKRFSSEKLTTLLALAGRSVADLRRSPRPRLALEVALARMARLEDPGALADILERLDRVAGGESSRADAPPAPPRPADRPHPPPPAATAKSGGAHEAPSRLPGEDDPGEEETAPIAAVTVADGPLGAAWTALLEGVRVKKRMLASFLDHGAPLSFEEGVFVAAFDNNYHEGMVNRRENLEIIETELARVAGGPVQFRAKRAPVAPRPTDRDEPRGARAADVLERNPGLNRLLHDLGGQLLPGGLGGGGGS